MRNIVLKKLSFSRIIIWFLIIVLLLIMFLVPLSMSRQGYSNVAFVPNTSNLNDLSFNQETNNGVINYEESFNKKTSTYVPNSMTPTNSDFYQIFGTAINSGGANTIIGNSYTQVGAMTGYCSDPTHYDKISCEKGNALWTEGMITKYPDVYFILIDDATTTNYPNGIASTFNSSHAGFLAGIVASITAIQLSSTPIIGTWGGMALTNVWEWMSGYEQAINWFNYAILGFDITGRSNNNPTPTKELLDIVPQYDYNNDGVQEGNDDWYNYSLNLQSTFNVTSPIRLTGGEGYQTTDSETYKGTNYQTWIESYSPSTEWYVGNFDSGQEATLRANAVEATGASVVFPVAGPQFVNALQDTNMYVIGVDSNIVLSNPSYEDKILGSATKNLKDATTLAIWYADRFRNEYNFSRPSDADLANSNSPSPSGWTVNDEQLYRQATTPITETYTSVEGQTVNSKVGTTSSEQYGWCNAQTKSECETISSTKGKHFLGTSLNKGIGFITSGPFLSEKSSSKFWKDFYNKLKNEGITINGNTLKEITTYEEYLISFNNFSTISFSANSIVVENNLIPFIEISSPTFSSDDKSFPPTVIGNTQISQYFLWIPNFTNE